MSKERRVNFHELLQQEVIEGGEEIGHDNDFDVAEESKHKLNIFWYGVKRGVTMLENQRSSLDDVKISEDEIDKDVLRLLWLIHPRGFFKFVWESILGLMAIYSVVVIPLEIGFEMESNLALRIIYDIITVFFGLDIFVNFNTAYLNPATDKLEVNRRDIALRYLSFWFWLDLVATIPFADFLWSNVKLIRFVRIFRLNRLSKIYQFRDFDKSVERYVDPALLNLLLLFLRIVFIGHLIACLWHYLTLPAAIGDFPRTWTTNPNFNLVLTTLKDRYVTSLYFAIITLLTIGYGDIYATNELERFFAIIIMLVGVIVVAALVNRVGAVISSRNADLKAFKRRMDQFKSDLIAAQVPQALSKRALSALRHYTKRRTTAKESEILNEIPPSIRRELVRRFYRSDLDRVRFLHSMDASFVVDIVMDLRPFRALPGDVIYREGDLCHDIIFLKAGLIEMSIRVLLPPDIDGEAPDPHRSVGCVLEGGFFGDTEWRHSSTCVASYTARNNCYLLMISHDCMERAIQRNPATAKAMKSMIDTRAQNLLFTIEQAQAAVYEESAKARREAAAAREIVVISGEASIIRTPTVAEPSDAVKGTTPTPMVSSPRKNMRRTSSVNADSIAQANSAVTATTDSKSFISFLPASAIISVSQTKKNIIRDDEDHDAGDVDNVDPNRVMKRADYVWMDGRVIEMDTATDAGVPSYQEHRDENTKHKQFKVRCLVRKVDPITGLKVNDSEVVELPLADVKKRFIIMPRHRWKMAWDLLIAIFVLLVMMIIPAELAFSVDDDRSSVEFDVVVNVLFIIDLVLTFFSVYYSNSHEAYVISRTLIAQHYVTSFWFYIDVISSIPLGIIIYAAGPSAKSRVASFALSLVRVLKLFRMLRMFKLNQNTQHMEDLLGVSPLVLSLIKTLVKTYMIAHWMACIWWGATTVISNTPWYTNYGPDGMIYGRLAGEKARAQYLVSLYYIFTTLTTVGYGDVRPTNLQERILGIFLAFLGVIAFTYTIAGISNAINTFISNDDEYKGKIAEVKAYLNEKRCPGHLQQQVLNQYQRRLTELSNVGIHDTLQCLPQMISARILASIYASKMQKIALFTYLPRKHDSIRVHIFQLLTPLICEEGYHLYREGRQVRELHFFVEGAGVVYRRSPRYQRLYFDSQEHHHSHVLRHHWKDFLRHGFHQYQHDEHQPVVTSSGKEKQQQMNICRENGGLKSRLENNQQVSLRQSNVYTGTTQSEKSSKGVQKRTHSAGDDALELSDIYASSSTDLPLHMLSMNAKSDVEAMADITQNGRGNLTRSLGSNCISSSKELTGGNEVTGRKMPSSFHIPAIVTSDTSASVRKTSTPPASMEYSVLSHKRYKPTILRYKDVVTSSPASSPRTTTNVVEAGLSREVTMNRMSINGSGKSSRSIKQESPSALLSLASAMQSSTNLIVQPDGNSHANGDDDSDYIPASRLHGNSLYSRMDSFGPSVTPSATPRAHAASWLPSWLPASLLRLAGQAPGATGQNYEHPDARQYIDQEDQHQQQQHRSRSLRTFTMKHHVAYPKLHVHDFHLLGLHKLHEVHVGEFAGHAGFLDHAVNLHPHGIFHRTESIRSKSRVPVSVSSDSSCEEDDGGGVPPDDDVNLYTGATKINSRMSNNNNSNNAHNYNQKHDTNTSNNKSLRSAVESREDYLSMQPRHTSSLCITKSATIYSLAKNDLAQLLTKDPVVGWTLQTALTRATTAQAHQGRRRMAREQRTQFLDLLRVQFVGKMWRQVIAAVREARHFLAHLEDEIQDTKKAPARKEISDGVLHAEKGTEVEQRTMKGRPSALRRASAVYHVITAAPPVSSAAIASSGIVPPVATITTTQEDTFHRQTLTSDGTIKSEETLRDKTLHALHVLTYLPTLRLAQQRIHQLIQHQVLQPRIQIMRHEGLPVYADEEEEEKGEGENNADEEADLEVGRTKHHNHTHHHHHRTSMSFNHKSSPPRRYSSIARHYLFVNPYTLHPHHQALADLQAETIRNVSLAFPQEHSRIQKLEILLVDERTARDTDDALVEKLKKRRLRRKVHHYQHYPQHAHHHRNSSGYDPSLPQTHEDSDAHLIGDETNHSHVQQRGRRGSTFDFLTTMTGSSSHHHLVVDSTTSPASSQAGGIVLPPSLQIPATNMTNNHNISISGDGTPSSTPSSTPQHLFQSNHSSHSNHVTPRATPGPRRNARRSIHVATHHSHSNHNLVVIPDRSSSQMDLVVQPSPGLADLSSNSNSNSVHNSCDNLAQLAISSANAAPPVRTSPFSLASLFPRASSMGDVGDLKEVEEEGDCKDGTATRKSDRDPDDEEKGLEDSSTQINREESTASSLPSSPRPMALNAHNTKQPSLGSSSPQPPQQAPSSSSIEMLHLPLDDLTSLLLDSVSFTRPRSHSDSSLQVTASHQRQYLPQPLYANNTGLCLLSQLPNGGPTQQQQQQVPMYYSVAQEVREVTTEDGAPWMGRDEDRDGEMKMSRVVGACDDWRVAHLLDYW